MKFSSKKKFFLLVFALGLFFILKAEFVYSAFSDCGITPVEPVWQVKSPDSTSIFSVDSAGNIDFSSNNVYTSTIPPGSFVDTFIIKDSYGFDKFSFNKEDIYIRGEIFQNQISISSDTNDLLVKNNSGDIVAKFDEAGDVYSKGQVCGTDNIIEISSCEELQMIGNDTPENLALCGAKCDNSSYPPNGSYSLSQDINCSATNPNNPANSGSLWDYTNPNSLGYGDGTIEGALGFSPLPAFKGIFDGYDKKITDLYINRISSSGVGLFSSLGDVFSQVEVINLDLENFIVKGYKRAGALAGAASKTYIDNVSLTGNSEVYIQDEYVGGLIGYAGNINITNSFVGSTGGNILIHGDAVETPNGYAGGIIGTLTSGSIKYSYVTDSVQVDYNKNYVGGLAGGNAGEISNCYSKATVKASGYTIGGLVGHNYFSGKILDSYSISNIDASGAGGLSGSNYSGANVSRTYSASNFDSSGKGLLGYNYNSTVSSSYWDQEVTILTDSCGNDSNGQCSNITPYNTKEMSYSANYPVWDFVNTWKIVEEGKYYPCLVWQDDSTCEKIPIIINSCEELQMIGHDDLLDQCGDKCDYDSYPLDGKYVLANDLDCSMTDPSSDIWDPSGIWADGLGFDPIAGNNCYDNPKKTLSIYTSIIIDMFSGTFDGMGHKISGVYINKDGLTKECVGVFGYVENGKLYNTNIEDVYITNSYGGSFDKATGILAAKIYDSDVKNCSTSGFIGGQKAGGLIGTAYGSTIDNCHSDIKVIDLESDMGGLIYELVGSTLTNSHAKTDYDFSPYGTNQLGVSGLVTRFTSSDTWGYYTGYDQALISDSYAETKNVGTGRGSSGLVGYAINYEANPVPIMAIVNSYANSQENNVYAGLAGMADGVDIINSYVVGKSNYGFTPSYSSSSEEVIDSFWNIEIASDYYGGCGAGSDCEVFGRDIYSMKSGIYPSNETGTYSNWDFINTWKLDDINVVNISTEYFPCLKWQDDSTCPQAPLKAISTCEELQKIGHSEFWTGDDYYPLDGSYILVGDIDCSMTNPEDDAWDSDGVWADGLGFDPIGDMSTGGFSGKLNGNYRTIDDLYINRQTEDNVGIFGYIDGDSISRSEIINLGIDSPVIFGNGYVGSVVGRANNVDLNNIDILNLNLDGRDSYAGGIVGYLDYGNLKDSKVYTYSLSRSNITSNKDMVGGLVGLSSFSEISRSYSKCSVIGRDEIGGLVGRSYKSSIDHSYTDGYINGDNKIGGLVGMTIDGSINDSYSAGDILLNNSYGGGLIGENSWGRINRSYSVSYIEGGSFTGGLIGFYHDNVPSSYVSDSYYNTETSGQSIACGLGDCSMINGLTISEMKSGESPSSENNFSDWNFVKDWKLDSVYDFLNKNVEYFPCLNWQVENTCIIAPTVIENCEDLQAMDTNYIKGVYALTHDIDCSMTNPTDPDWDSDGTWGDSKGFNPIGYYDSYYGKIDVSFEGTFNGHGYGINDLYINRPDERYVALFVSIEGGGVSVRNLALNNVNITALFAAGVSANVNNIAIISNCHVSGEISGGAGIAGYNKGIIKNCYNMANGVNYGIAVTNDRADSLILNSYNTVDSVFGGLVGNNYREAQIISSYNLGNVSGNLTSKYASGVGGIASYNYQAYIYDSYNLGSIETNYNAGGIAGKNQAGYIYNSYNLGDVSGASGIVDSYGGVGGLVGFNNSGYIYNSYNQGDVSGNYNIGGLIGHNYSSDYVINNSYSSGKIANAVNAGGVIGQNDPANIGCYNTYWDSDVASVPNGCGLGDCAGAEGTSTPSMIQMTTYSNWNFADIWHIDDGNTYPCHQWWVDQGETCIEPPNYCRIGGEIPCVVP